jgi:hypothetical protein
LGYLSRWPNTAIREASGLVNLHLPPFLGQYVGKVTFHADPPLTGTHLQHTHTRILPYNTNIDNVAGIRHFLEVVEGDFLQPGEGSLAQQMGINHIILIYIAEQ